LIFGNRTVEDILLRDELEGYVENHKDNFKCFFTVDIAPDAALNWKHGVGFVTKEMIEKCLPAPGPDTIILYCGPPPFETMMQKHMTDLGYGKDMVFKF